MVRTHAFAGKKDYMIFCFDYAPFAYFIWAFRNQFCNNVCCAFLHSCSMMIDGGGNEFFNGACTRIGSSFNKKATPIVT